MTPKGPSTTVKKLIWGPTSNVPNIHSGLSYEDTDYDGTANTAAIVATGKLSSYPAANACQSYAPTGTSTGDWYLPAMQELKAVYTNKSTINSQLTALQTNYSSDCMSAIEDDGYWSSTVYGSAYWGGTTYYMVYYVTMENGSSTATNANDTFRGVISMLKL